MPTGLFERGKLRLSLISIMAPYLVLSRALHTFHQIYQRVSLLCGFYVHNTSRKVTVHLQLVGYNNRVYLIQHFVSKRTFGANRPCQCQSNPQKHVSKLFWWFTYCFINLHSLQIIWQLHFLTTRDVIPQIRRSQHNAFEHFFSS